MKKYVVYKHTNKLNGKVYIGITSQNPENRWKNGNGYSNQHFSRAIKKYGWDNFDHDIVAKELSKEDACEMERILIKSYRSTDPEYGYNETLGGDGGGMYRKNHSQDAKDKISKARKRMGFSETHRKNISKSKSGVNHHLAKKVYQYSKQGEYITEWDYMSLASKELNICKSSIAQVCSGKRKTAGGYVWKYERT